MPKVAHAALTTVCTDHQLAKTSLMQPDLHRPHCVRSLDFELKRSDVGEWPERFKIRSEMECQLTWKVRHHVTREDRNVDSRCDTIEVYEWAPKLKCSPHGFVRLVGRVFAFVSINEIVLIRPDLVIVSSFPPCTGFSRDNGQRCSACRCELTWSPDPFVIVSEGDPFTLEAESFVQATCGDNSTLTFS